MVIMDREFPAMRPRVDSHQIPPQPEEEKKSETCKDIPKHRLFQSFEKISIDNNWSKNLTHEPEMNKKFASYGQQNDNSKYKCVVTQQDDDEIFKASKGVTSNVKEDRGYSDEFPDSLFQVDKFKVQSKGKKSTHKPKPSKTCSTEDKDQRKQKIEKASMKKANKNKNKEMKKEKYRKR